VCTCIYPVATRAPFPLQDTHRAPFPPSSPPLLLSASQRRTGAAMHRRRRALVRVQEGGCSALCGIRMEHVCHDRHGDAARGIVCRTNERNRGNRVGIAWNRDCRQHERPSTSDTMNRTPATTKLDDSEISRYDRLYLLQHEKTVKKTCSKDSAQFILPNRHQPRLGMVPTISGVQLVALKCFRIAS
jgi:hypothetical protein